MKFSGIIGFWEDDVETTAGVYRPKITERPYTGDLKRNFRSFQESDKQNDDISTSNQIEILADFYLKQNLTSIRYVIWNGNRWKAKNVTVNHPRIVIELGGVYNGPEKSD